MVHIFIVNPYAGDKTFAEDLRAKLESIENLNYFVFNTRYAGYETELVRKIQKIFDGEELRFYCCGGSGTMRNMLQGFDDLSKAEVAFYPCGLTNDFLKVFGKDMECFNDIEELIDGEVIEIDYIQSDYGVAINTVSLGLDGKMGDKIEEYRVLRYIGKDLPYFASIVYAIFFSKSKEYELEVDDKKYRGKFSEIIFGKGMVIGGNMWFSEKNNITDGLGRACFLSAKRGLGILKDLKIVSSKNFEKLKQVATQCEGKKFHFKCIEGEGILNLDGELIRNVKEANVHIVNKGLKFVVPKGVKR